MYIDKIRETFERGQLRPNSQITRQDLYDFLSKLTVTGLLFSPDKPTMSKWPTSSGNRPHEEATSSMSTASARPSMTVSTFCKSNWTKSTVPISLCRLDQIAIEIKDEGFQLRGSQQERAIQNRE